MPFTHTAFSISEWLFNIPHKESEKKVCGVYADNLVEKVYSRAGKKGKMLKCNDSECCLLNHSC